MDITISNDIIRITTPDVDVLDFIKTALTYVDKSKQYQIKRMSKNLWSKMSPLYKELQSQVKGELFSFENNILTFPAACFNLLLDKFPSMIYTDLRVETGAKIVLPWVNKPDPLRDYQDEAVSLMWSNYRGLVNLATALGKTLLATHFVQQYKKKTLIVCPSDSVAKQFYEQFVSCFGKQKVGFYGGGKKEISDITVGIAASITRNISDFQNAELGLVIFDETHHTPASTFFDVAQGLAMVGKIFGLTATDYRSDGKDIMITAGCGSVIIRKDIKWGIENGWLAEPYFIVRTIKTTGKDFKDDKLKSYKAHVLNCNVMKTQIQNDAQAMMAAGKAVLILVDEVAHGRELSTALGIPFATGLDAKSQQYVELLNKGKIPGLVGTDGKIGEGSNTKNVDVLILANFVAAKGPVMQAIGRGLRKQGNKTKCIILDYIPAGSTMLRRHANNRINYYLEITQKVKVI